MRITIIGGGPGGYTAAFAAAQKGCDVTLVEADSLGGTCLNRGCIPTKTLRASADALLTGMRLAEYGVTGCGEPGIDLDAVRRRKENVINILKTGLEKTCAHHKVQVITGTGRVVDAHTTVVRNATGEETVINGDAIIIAAGSRTLQLPELTVDHTYICSSDDALQLTHVPQRLIIVGGGVIGCEMACIYRAFGSSVTVVEGQDRLLPMPSVDQDVSTLLNREMRKQKIKILLGKTLSDVRIENGVVHGTVGPSPFTAQASNVQEPETLEADMVLVTVGRVPATELGLAEAGIAVDKRGWITVDDNLQTSVPGVYAIGDILGPSRVMLAHVAAMEAHCVIDSLCGSQHAMAYDAVPSAIFTTPEIGEVGLSEAQALQTGANVVCGVTQMRELGKAHAMGELPGFFKVVADADSGRVLGVHIAGAHSSDLVAEAGLAINMGATLHDIAHTIHAHPTLAEGLHEAVHAALRAMKN